jgi:putative nucleotidyltransferase with HDIG domain
MLVPRPEDCRALWQRYAMLDHIKAHSAKVADFAHALALAAKAKGGAVDPDAVLAAGLLHDLGKTYTIYHGGNHAQLGASWVMRETGNPAIARAVMFHVHWPFEERPDDDGLFMVMAIIYADKRTKHDAYVSLEERFEDLLVRYAVNDHIRGRIGLSHAQGKRIEAALSRRLGVNLHECTADSGRLVQ